MREFLQERPKVIGDVCFRRDAGHFPALGRVVVLLPISPVTNAAFLDMNSFAPG
jgi:hypothetical protein